MTSNDFDLDGYQRIAAAVDAIDLQGIREHLNLVPLGGAGTRNLLSFEWCRQLSNAIRGVLIDRGLLSGGEVPVQCTLFRKMHLRNWKVPWHQDVFIPVARRIRHPELSGWSEKEGNHFVKAPAQLLRRMLAARLHLDACGEGDGPLSVVPGSHRHGPMSMEQARSLHQLQPKETCLADAGDLLIMSPLLLHSSSVARRPQGMRRVLHFLFAPGDPGYGLNWSIAA